MSVEPFSIILPRDTRRMLSALSTQLKGKMQRALHEVAVAAGAGEVRGEVIGRAFDQGAWIFCQVDKGARTVTLVGTAQVRARMGAQVVPRAYVRHVRGRTQRPMRVRPRRR